jgi:CP family cyanate transporter-like MFS transporter
MMGLMAGNESLSAKSAAALDGADGSRAPASSATETAPRRQAPGAWRTRVLVVGMVLAALNLRPAVTSLGALLEEVRDGLGMNGTVAGLLTSVPPLCFAVFGVTAPRLARRFGPSTVVCAAMVAVATGLGIRPYTGTTAGLLVASAVALIGIAVSNVLMPVIVKRYFPDRVGQMTGLYSMALSFGTALAAGVTVPVTNALGGSWQLGLAVWAVPAVAAVLPWLPFVRDRQTTGASPAGGAATTAPAGTAAAHAAPANAAPDQPAGQHAGQPALRISRSRTAWALAVFMGLQSTGAYITMGWMPQIFRDAGLSADTAGLLLAVTMMVGVPLAFLIPRMAARLPHQGPVVITLGVCGLAGYAGLYLAPAGGAWLWALLLGIANCTFPLALTMVGMRARTGPGVAQLSAFAQSTGYLISIPGPLLVGVLYQSSGGWGLPIALMTGLLVPQMAVGWLAGRNRMVEDEATH